MIKWLMLAFLVANVYCAVTLRSWFNAVVVFVLVLALFDGLTRGWAPLPWERRRR